MACSTDSPASPRTERPPAAAISRIASPRRCRVGDLAVASAPAAVELESLSLCGCGIGVRGAQALGHVLSVGRLSTLRLARNQLTEAGVRALADALGGMDGEDEGLAPHARADRTRGRSAVPRARKYDESAALLVGWLSRPWVRP